MSCHNGRNLGGNLMQNVGLKDTSENKRLMRVPSLRNITRTAPYLSSGDISDLKRGYRLCQLSSASDCTK